MIRTTLTWYLVPTRYNCALYKHSRQPTSSQSFLHYLFLGIAVISHPTPLIEMQFKFLLHKCALCNSIVIFFTSPPQKNQHSVFNTLTHTYQPTQYHRLHAYISLYINLQASLQTLIKNRSILTRLTI